MLVRVQQALERNEVQCSWYQGKRPSAVVVTRCSNAENEGNGEWVHYYRERITRLTHELNQLESVSVAHLVAGE